MGSGVSAFNAALRVNAAMRVTPDRATPPTVAATTGTSGIVTTSDCGSDRALVVTAVVLDFGWYRMAFAIATHPDTAAKHLNTVAW